MAAQGSYFIGIDVGTGSARAGIYDASGRSHGFGSCNIKMWKPQPEWAEQSSDDIWQACGQAVQQALKQGGVNPAQIAGIGFDATCSLVVLDGEDKAVSVATSGEDARNVIVWMDHRAIAQAERINAGEYEVLKYVGGRVSPEMEVPKLLWLKENLPAAWKRARRFFDLPDYLTYRATGSETRSLCSTVCKWNYQGHKSPTIEGSVGAWDGTYLRAVGLGDLVDERYSRIGTIVRPMGEGLAKGLTAKAAQELGLEPGTAVSVSIIDAHAGGLGLLGAQLANERLTPTVLETRLALIGGTSSCHMAVSRDSCFVPGVWGPYFSAMIPGMWLTEGGQSATGALVDHIIFGSNKAEELKSEAAAKGSTVYEILNQRLEKLGAGANFPALLTRDLHVLPYFHGNRSPRADPTLRGMISGLRLSDSLDDLALIYLATIQGIAYGTRHIIEEMNSNGFAIDTMIACGGGTKNSVFLREHADITGCRLLLPKEPEAVLMGAAVLGAVAAKQFGSVIDAMAAMNAIGGEQKAAAGEVVSYHQAKYEVFLRMYQDQLVYRETMGV